MLNRDSVDIYNKVMQLKLGLLTRVSLEDYHSAGLSAGTLNSYDLCH